jgi:hypothetical protein
MTRTSAERTTVSWRHCRPIFFSKSMAAAVTMAAVLMTTHDSSKKDNGVVMASLALSCWLDGDGDNNDGAVADNCARQQWQWG